MPASLKRRFEETGPTLTPSTTSPDHKRLRDAAISMPLNFYVDSTQSSSNRDNLTLNVNLTHQIYLSFPNYSPSCQATPTMVASKEVKEQPILYETPIRTPVDSPVVLDRWSQPAQPPSNYIIKTPATPIQIVSSSPHVGTHQVATGGSDSATEDSIADYQSPKSEPTQPFRDVLSPALPHCAGAAFSDSAVHSNLERVQRKALKPLGAAGTSRFGRTSIDVLAKVAEPSRAQK